jgi:hypothetical protein
MRYSLLACFASCLHAVLDTDAAADLRVSFAADVPHDR